MDKSLEEQKDFLIDAVLDLKQKVESLDFLIEKLKEQELPEVKLTFQIFNSLLGFIYLLLWENITINLYWLFDKRKGQRNLIWYLNEAKSSTLSSPKIDIDKQIKRIESLNKEIEKVKRFRDKWIAHRDKQTFENYEEFWAKNARLTINEVKDLANCAYEIIQEHFPVTDLTSSGVNVPFLLSKVFIEEDFTYQLNEWGLIDRE
jgi:hypothetical protein